MNEVGRKILLSALLTIGLLSVLATSALADNRSVTGRVTDDKGQPVVNAQITIMGTDIVQNFRTKTDKKGNYTYLLGLQPGTYRIIVRAAGFQPQYVENIAPGLGEIKTINFKLTPGQDSKLPWELTTAERKQMEQQQVQSVQKKQFSGEVKAHFDQGVQLSDQGKFAEAIEEFGKALERDPNQPGILARQADCYTKLGKNEDALAAYQKAIAITPNDAELYSNMGVLLNKMGKVTESEDAFNKAATLSPGSSAQSLYNLGVTMFNAGHVQEAIDAFKRSIASDPNFSESYFQLGICLSSKADTIPAAIEAMKKYVQIGKKPDQVEVAKQVIATLSGK